MARDFLTNKYDYLNFFIVGLFLILWSFIYFIVPLNFINSDFIVYIPLLGILSYPFWVIIHDAIHTTLFTNPAFNNFYGRVISIFFGAPFRILQGGHLMHHGYNRTKEEITDYYDPDKSNKVFAYFKYYFWILGGLYIFEVLSNLIAFIPKSFMNKLKDYFKDRSSLKFNYISFILLHYRQIQMDAIFIILFYGLIFYLYGENYYIFLLFLMVRALTISIMDNVFHYGTEPDKVISGYNLKIPAIFKYIVFNGNLHGFHHIKPKIPWYNLENEFHKSNQTIDGILWKQLLKQLYGPIPYK